MSSTALVTLALAASQTYVVDDDGGGDFKDLPAAVAAAASGDVLLVEPGSYSAFEATESISVIARPGGARPDVVGEVHVHDVKSVAIVGLELDELRIENVSGRARVDDCFVSGSSDLGAFGTFWIADCGDFLVSRTVAFGHAPVAFDGTAALQVEDSKGQIVDCSLFGPAGHDDVLEPDDGYPGLAVRGACDVWVAGSDVFGGDGGCHPFPLLGGQGSPAITGSGIGLSQVNVRGSSFQQIRGGLSCAGIQAHASSGVDDLDWSGVTMSPGPPPGGTWILPAQPYLSVRGSDAPGEARVARLFGQVGDSAFLFLAFGPACFELPGFLGAPIWFDPAGMVSATGVALLGQDVGVQIDVPLPPNPAFAGLALEAQALQLFVGGIPGPTPVMTNGSQIVLRF